MNELIFDPSETFDLDRFKEFMIRNSVIGLWEESRVLKSGRESHWYANWRTVMAYYYPMVMTSEFLTSFLLSKYPRIDSVIGVPDGATKLGLKTQELLIPHEWPSQQCLYSNEDISYVGYPQVRVTPKDHGDPADRYFLGEPSGKIAVVEDVTTTGGSLFAVVERVLELPGVSPDDVYAVGLFDRGELRKDGDTVKEGLKKSLGVEYDCLCSARDIMEHVLKHHLNQGKTDLVSKVVQELRETLSPPKPLWLNHFDS